MIWRPAYWADIQAVMADLSDQHQAEYAKFGSPSAAFDLELQAAYACGDAYCLVFDDTPQAFFVIHTSGGCNVCWFGATKKAFERYHEMIRSGRKHLRKMADKHGPFMAVTASTHPMADRWLELLGFKLFDRVSHDRRVFSYA